MNPDDLRQIPDAVYYVAYVVKVGIFSMVLTAGWVVYSLWDRRK